MTELLFLVEEDSEGGFTARSVGPSIFTQADSREQLIEAIRDAVRCHFDRDDDLPKVLRLHFVRDEVVVL